MVNDVLRCMSVVYGGDLEKLCYQFVKFLQSSQGRCWIRSSCTLHPTWRHVSHVEGSMHSTQKDRWCSKFEAPKKSTLTLRPVAKLSEAPNSLLSAIQDNFDSEMSSLVLQQQSIGLFVQVFSFRKSNQSLLQKKKALE